MAMKNPKLQQSLDDLKRERDELKLQLHLAKAEVRDEWEELERKWNHVRPQLEKRGGEIAEDTKKTVGVIAEEIMEGYRRIRERL